MLRVFHKWRLFLLALVAVSATAEQALVYEINGTTNQLRRNMVAWLGDTPDTPAERILFLSEVDQALQNALHSLGYYQAVINKRLDKSETPWVLTLDIDRGPRVRWGEVNIAIVGEANEHPVFQQFLAEVKVKPGELLNQGKYESAKRRLVALGNGNGFFDGGVTRAQIKIDVARNIGDVDLVYESGPRYRFGELNYDGDLLARDKLEALSDLAPGEPFEEGKLQDLQAKLMETGYFASARVLPEQPDPATATVPLTLDLQPMAKHRIDLGVGYSTDTRNRLSATWRTPRINAAGHSQETRAQYSTVNPAFTTTYRIPLTHPLDDVLQLQGRFENNDFGDFTSLQREFKVARDVRGEKWVRSYSLRLLDESWGLGDGIDPRQSLLIPGISLSRKYRKGRLVDPEAGLSQYYLFEAAESVLGSDVTFYRLFADLTWVQTLAKDHRLVLRTTAGYVSFSDIDRLELPPSVSFFAGGSESVRGFGYQALGTEVEVIEDGQPVTKLIGGTRLLTGSAEYQYYFNESWRGALFIDAGDAFDGNEFETNRGVGVGVHYLTSVGAIRLDIARGENSDLSEWRFHINVGAEF